MLSKTVESVKPSLTMKISALALEMKRKGEDVINLSAGEPESPVSKHIIQAGIDSLKANFTKYTVSTGIPELKEAVRAKFLKDNNVDYSTKNIIITNGGKQALFNAIFALANKGDEFIIPVPYWVSYVEQVKLAGAKPVFTHTKDFQITADLIEEKITEKIKCIILNSPCNPTGSIISKRELEKIAEIAVKNDIYVISDEVYEPFTYEGRHYSIASLNDEIKKRTITINALSKFYSMTGLRIGYCGGPEELISLMGRIQDHSTSNACSIAQKMALAALSGPQESVEKNKSEFQKKRDHVIKELNNMGLECKTPEGAFYAFPSIKSTGLDSMQFCERLLSEHKVAVVPGIGFGNDKHIRLSFVAQTEKIKQGLEHIKKFVEGIKNEK